jgi:excisionase family DNA binding protein
MRRTAVTPTPKPEEADLARSALQELSLTLESDGPVRLRVNETPDEIVVPRSAFTAFGQILASMARGAAVSVLPKDAEMTTPQAADALNVSRPYLIELLESGAIQYRMVGSHRRINVTSLLRYKETEYKRSKAVADALTADALELGFIS